MPLKSPVKKTTNKKSRKPLASGGNYTEGTTLYPQLRPKNSIVYESYTGDWQDLVSECDRHREVSISKWLFRNCPPITGAVLDIGNYSVGNAWRPVFLGQDQEWGKSAKDWLEQWFKIGNVFGNGYDLWDDLNIASYDLDVRGDTLLVLTYGSSEKYPMWQWIQSEQIGNRDKQDVIKRGPFSGYPVEHGVVHNGIRVIGYQILGDDESDDVVVSEQDSLLLFEPRDSRQLRGEPALVSSLNTVRDYRIWMDYEREKAKILASQVMSIETMAGEADVDPTLELNTPSDTGGGADGVYGKYIRGSNIQIFKAGAGESIKPIEHSNPSTNSQEFITNQVLRAAFAGLEWPVEMYDISALRTGPVRFIKEKVMKKILKRQETLSAAYMRLVYYGVSKAIKLGLLPEHEEFLKWGYQLPEEITIDAGRDSAASMNELDKGAMTYREYYGKRGKDYREELDQWEYEKVYREIARKKAIELIKNETDTIPESTGDQESEGTTE